MIVAYYSLTGNTRRLVARLAPPGERVELTRDTTLTEPFVLVTPTYNFGEIPQVVAEFLESNNEYLVAVIGTGNRNWADNFAIAGRKVATRYGVPLIGTVELAGTPEDYRTLIERMRLLDEIH
ncbi:class Ib ribonucleoside-diphosphate reductase assembly flavoprotein NrdI [Alkalihalobacillus pseudalcaliphilus]|uniref:class Ib ribonucleoside-diphosphate reductase assembly flavoprotein NrdI n=1 Tax=Alkalihalobacillus pseudalcaliphilus TaxID=79884 RepID=UPI00064DDCCB|nr:class Ib ribonucleoside-diphosphate reductase assembly flavoprotein NrdI [Alkalihalobacillus pseudalcaliphilus]KMK75428.1 hypothetical protein AB990_08920 [Alkalihalobacillus pseudalcaliphilus]